MSVPILLWEAKTIGDLADSIQYGLSIKGQEQGAIPILRMNCQVRGRICWEGLQFVDIDSATQKSFRLNRGDILFNRTNSFELVGRTAIYDSDVPAVFASYLLRLGLRRTIVNPEFLNFWFNMPATQADLKRLASRGVSQSNINASKLREYGVWLPPLPEQEKIAAVLWKVQRAVETEEKLIATTKELKQATMRQLFTRGLRHEPTKQTEIGEMPVGWRMEPLGSHFQTQLGKMLSQKARSGRRPFPYLRNKNVQWGRVDVSDLLQMDFNEQETHKFRLQKGDLLVCEGGIIGRAAIWEGPVENCYYQKALHRIRPTETTQTNQFLCYWLSLAFEHQNLYKLGGASSTIAHLPETQLLRLPIPIPPLAEQQEIAGILQTIDRKISVHERKRAALQELFQTLLHELMTGQRRVHELAIDTKEEGL